MSKKKASRGWRYFFYAVVGLGITLMLTLIVLVFGTVSGIEFSPTHFETRRFSVREIPLLQIQISPIQRTQSQSKLARYLVAQSLVQVSSGIPNDWHLVELTRGGISSSEADAKLLVKQLEESYIPQTTTTQVDSYWHDWSIRKPDLAKVLWPTIQRLAVRELYILMPKLFALAMEGEDATSLRNDIDNYLRSSYAELVQEMRDANRTDLASELLKEALQDYPNDQKLRALQ